eukprot:15484632-Alexandrium_andersonii.AAC.1
MAPLQHHSALQRLRSFTTPCWNGSVLTPLRVGTTSVQHHFVVERFRSNTTSCWSDFVLTPPRVGTTSF